MRKHHPWNGRLIRDLDISRQTVIVMIKRGDTSIIPRGNLILLEGDRIILYSQSFIVNADTIHV